MITTWALQVYCNSVDRHVWLVRIGFLAECVIVIMDDSSVSIPQLMPSATSKAQFSSHPSQDSYLVTVLP